MSTVFYIAFAIVAFGIWLAARSGRGYEAARNDRYHSGIAFTVDVEEDGWEEEGDYDAEIDSLKDGDTLVATADYTKPEVRAVIDEVNAKTDFDLNVSGTKSEMVARVNDALDVIHR